MRNTQPEDQQKVVDLLTVTEAANLLRLKPSTMRAWILHRRIPYIKMGGKRVFLRRSDLVALIERSVVPCGIQIEKQKKAA